MVSENIFLEISKKVQNLGFKQSLIHISQIAMNDMNIQTFGVWTFEENNLFKCRFRRQKDKQNFNCNEVRDLNKYPIYLQALKSDTILKINDVHRDYRTSEYMDIFDKLKIKSTLQIPIYIDGIQYGMVMFSKDEYYNWTNEDVIFGSDVSQVISIAYISSKRIEDLRKLNSYAEKIKQYNIELQEIINKKNEQFIEYGFINSHLLNAPLSRLKGLMNILVLELNGERKQSEIDFIISKIYEEYDEMDKIVTKISVLVNKGASPSRDSIDPPTL